MIGTYLPFVLSALWAAVVIRLVARDVRYLIPIVLVALIWIVPMTIQRRRQRALLLRGDVPAVIEAWNPVIARTPFPETMQPLLVATAYAANGWTEAARDAVRKAQKGQAWDAAREQRLVVQTLLEAFDGDRSRALESSAELSAMPLPPVGVFLRRRIQLLRAGMASFARAFNRIATETDRETLLAAASSSPLLHWAFSYAAAVVAIDEGKPQLARKAIRGAPMWSASSTFA